MATLPPATLALIEPAAFKQASAEILGDRAPRSRNARLNVIRDLLEHLPPQYHQEFILTYLPMLLELRLAFFCFVLWSAHPGLSPQLSFSASLRLCVSVHFFLSPRPPRTPIRISLNQFSFLHLLVL